MSAKATASVLSPPTRSFTPAPANLLQRQCACGGSAGLAGTCETCQQKTLTGSQPPLIQPKLKVSQPNDPYEQEADRVADEVMRMPEPKVQRQVGVEEDEDEKTIQTKPIASQITPLVQRQIGPDEEGKKLPLNPRSDSEAIPTQETGGKQKSNNEEAKDAVKKTSEAFPKTELGKKIVNQGKEIVSTLPGKVIVGTVAVGAVSALIATNKKLPIQAPAIPLDIIHPGLSMRITVDGPLRSPTNAMIRFSGTFGLGKRRASRKQDKTETEKLQEETNRKLREEIEFRESLKTPEEKARDNQRLVDTLTSRLPIPGLKSQEEVPAAEKEKKEETPVHRKKSNSSIGICSDTSMIKEATQSSNDKYEQEADRVVDMVMRMPMLAIKRQAMDEDEDEELLQTERLANQITPLVQRETMAIEDDEDEQEVLQRKAGMEEQDTEKMLQSKNATAPTPRATRPVEAAIHNMRQGGGQPLDPATRSFFEPRLSRSFANVRIHTDPKARESTAALNARAFTVGHDIFFNASDFQPATDSGRRLLAHELTHTLQQQGPGIIRRDGNHTDLTDQARYEHTLQHAGTNRAEWERGYHAATFLGVRITNGIHQELANRLTLAEDHLRTRFPGIDDEEIAQAISLDTISGRRIPGTAVSGSTISNHGYGLAIDVNYRANPFVGRSETVDEIMNRATQLVLGREFHIRQQQEGTSEDVRARYADASAALSTYFRYYMDQDFEGLAAAMAAATAQECREFPEAAPWSSPNASETMCLTGSPNASEAMAMMDQIADDYNNPELLADFATNSGPNRDPVNGFIDLSAALLEAFVDQAGLNWGGQYRTGKDIMHFDWRGGTVRTTHRI